MSQVSFALLIAIGLTLTAYFGVAAWRLSDDQQMDITGTSSLPSKTRGGRSRPIAEQIFFFPSDSGCALMPDHLRLTLKRFDQCLAR